MNEVSLPVFVHVVVGGDGLEPKCACMGAGAEGEAGGKGNGAGRACCGPGEVVVLRRSVLAKYMCRRMR